MTKKGGEYFEPKDVDRVLNFINYCKIKYHYDEETGIYYVSRETYRIMLMLIINEIDF